MLITDISSLITSTITWIELRYINCDFTITLILTKGSDWLVCDDRNLIIGFISAFQSLSFQVYDTLVHFSSIKFYHYFPKGLFYYSFVEKTLLGYNFSIISKLKRGIAINKSKICQCYDNLNFLLNSNSFQTLFLI